MEKEYIIRNIDDKIQITFDIEYKLNEGIAYIHLILPANDSGFLIEELQSSKESVLGKKLWKMWGKEVLLGSDHNNRFREASIPFYIPDNMTVAKQVVYDAIDSITNKLKQISTENKREMSKNFEKEETIVLGNKTANNMIIQIILKEFFFFDTYDRGWYYILHVGLPSEVQQGRIIPNTKILRIADKSEILSKYNLFLDANTDIETIGNEQYVFLRSKIYSCGNNYNKAVQIAEEIKTQVVNSIEKEILKNREHDIMLMKSEQR